MSPETITLLGLLAVVAVVVLGGLGLSVAQRRGRDEASLRGFGFAKRDAQYVGRWEGRELQIALRGREPMQVRVGLSAAPLPHETLARALGRGDLLARLYQLDATAGRDELVARLPAGLRARALRFLLDDVATLARLLDEAPRAEAMARWYLDLATHEDRAAAFEALLAAFPDAPETQAVCRSEAEDGSDPRVAALARAHLIAQGLAEPGGPRTIVQRSSKPA